MNIFEFHFRLNGQEYYIYIDSSNENNKKILINGKEVVNEHSEMVFTRNAHIAYYPINIDGNEFIILIDDSQFSHDYNIYLDGVSLLDQSCLNTKYSCAKDKIKDGFLFFCKENWRDIFKKNIISLMIGLLLIALINDFKPVKVAIIVCLFIICFPLILFLIILAEWWNYKSIINSYSKQFRVQNYYNSNQSGDGSVC